MTLSHARAILLLSYCAPAIALALDAGMGMGASNRSDVERLHFHLLHNYKNSRVPISQVDGRRVNATVYIWPYDILYVKEAQGAIKISGWIDMRWQDPHLVWDPNDFGGLNETFIMRHQLWLPLLDLFYSKDDEPMVSSCDTCAVHVDADGGVLRGYYFAYSFPCKIDVKYFPFDEHKCTMSLANWHMDDRFMDLQLEIEEVDLSTFLPNEEWNLTRMSVTRTREYYNYGFFPVLHYTLHIQRKPFYYVCNLVIPTIILTLTALIGYHMPSAGNGMHQEKVKMGLTTILSIFILQLGVSDKLPRTSDVVPLIAVFYSCMVGLLSLAIVATSIVIVIEKQGVYGEPVPRWLTVLFRLPFQQLTARKHKNVETNARMLDCGCRLKSTRNGHGQYKLLDKFTDSASPSPGSTKRNSQNQEALQGVQLTQSVLLAALADLRVINDMSRVDAEKTEEMNAVRIEWMQLADSAENVSLIVFVLGCAISVAMFFYHDWY